MRYICAALIFASLFATGCGNPETKYVGHYTGSIELDQALLDQIKVIASQNGEDPEATIKMITDLDSSLELKEDGAFVETTIIGANQRNSEGTWTLSSDETKP